jgi:hypothetical protein
MTSKCDKSSSVVFSNCQLMWNSDQYKPCSWHPVALCFLSGKWTSYKTEVTHDLSGSNIKCRTEYPAVVSFYANRVDKLAAVGNISYILIYVRKPRTSSCQVWDEELQTVTVLRNTIDPIPCSHKIRHWTRELKGTNSKSHWNTSIKVLSWVLAFIVTWRLCPKLANLLTTQYHVTLFRQNHNATRRGFCVSNKMGLDFMIEFTGPLYNWLQQFTNHYLTHYYLPPTGHSTGTILTSNWTPLFSSVLCTPRKTPSSVVKNACLLVGYLAMDVLLLLRPYASGMCLPSRCLTMGICVTIT